MSSDSDYDTSSNDVRAKNNIKANDYTPPIYEKSDVERKKIADALKKWTANELDIRDVNKKYEAPPLEPPISDKMNIVHPSKAPRRGKGGSLKSRIAILHALCHVESVAIDLSWDIIYRYAFENNNELSLPKEFFDDWFKVAVDEAKHFEIWSNRLKELGSFYGELNIHKGLWHDALSTKDSLAERLAIVHMVHEARGLDITPQTITRLRNGNDEKSADLLYEIYKDEITHVAAGVKWFRWLYKDLNENEIIKEFHQAVHKHFRGSLKGPFNDDGRAQALFPKEWYMPLAIQK